MTDKYFHLRLSCTYLGNENNIDDLNIEVLNDNKWEPLDLGIRSPGFLLFISGLFSCQHLYMRTNSAERGLIINSTVGDLQVRTGKYWDIKDATIAFDVKLESGSPSDDDINYIIDRMKHCPVSANISSSTRLTSSVHFKEQHDYKAT